MTKRKEVIRTDKAPSAIGPYSLGIRTQDLIFLSGAIGVDPESGTLVAGGVGAEARQALTNMTNILSAAGSDMASVVKTTVFLTDIGDYGEVNEVYAEFFSDEPPARSAIQVAALPGGALVEIEAIAQI
ncbi:MAG: RidA family protein [Anaerolineales bacterium]